MAEEQAQPKPLSRSEREAQIKDKAGLVIVIMALFMAVTTYFSNSYSGAVLKNMLKATDTYAFYQSKSIKQSIAEGQLEETRDPQRRAELVAKIARYESDPAKGEGKRELLQKAQAHEAARDEATRHTPWLTFASLSFQLAIVCAWWLDHVLLRRPVPFATVRACLRSLLGLIHSEQSWLQVLLCAGGHGFLLTVLQRCFA